MPKFYSCVLYDVSKNGIWKDNSYCMPCLELLASVSLLKYYKEILKTPFSAHEGIGDTGNIPKF